MSDQSIRLTSAQSGVAAAADSTIGLWVQYGQQPRMCAWRVGASGSLSRPITIVSLASCVQTTAGWQLLLQLSTGRKFDCYVKLPDKIAHVELLPVAHKTAWLVDVRKK